VGTYTSVALGADDRPLVAYRDETGDALKLAHCNDEACAAASVTTVDAAVGAGTYASVTIGSDALPLVAYLQGSAGAERLRLAHCSNPTCTQASLRILDDLAGGWSNALTIGADGWPLVASQQQGSGGGLKVFHLSNTFGLRRFRAR